MPAKKIVLKKEEIKPRYKLTVQIGRKQDNDKLYKFETDDLAQALTSICIPKMMEEVFFTLEDTQEKKVANNSLNAFRARRVFNREINAFHFIRNLKFLLK